MTWLRLPRTSSASLSEGGGSSAESLELSDESAARLASCVLSRSKRMPPRLWRRAWKRARWMTRLSGVTLEHSTLERGVASWISSLLATRASRSRSRGSGWEQMTLGIFGPPSRASSASASPLCASLRTSPVTCLPEHAKSSESFKKWASALRLHCGRRRKSALLTVESAFSSSLPTPSASSYGTNKGGAAGRTGAERPSLETMARKALFPTPSASHCETRPGATFDTKGQATSCLGAMAKHNMFPTPLASSGGGNFRRGNPKLTSMATRASWPTPRATDGTNGAVSVHASSARRYVEGKATLSEAANLHPDPRVWPTPTVNGNHNRKGASPESGDGLSTAVGGGPLNPTWVEWLMGWPSGWSDCGSSETASCRNARKKLCSSVSMLSESEAAHA